MKPPDGCLSITENGCTIEIIGSNSGVVALNAKFVDVKRQRIYSEFQWTKMTTKDVGTEFGEMIGEIIVETCNPMFIALDDKLDGCI